MKLPDFLKAHPDGEIRLSGTRISLVQVVDLYNEGSSPRKIYEEFLSPSLEQINQVITFCLENRADVNTYVAQSHAEMERNAAKVHPSPGIPKYAGSGKPLRKPTRRTQQIQSGQRYPWGRSCGVSIYSMIQKRRRD